MGMVPVARTVFLTPPVVLSILLLGGVPGCSKSKAEGPKLYSVKGKIVFKNGEPLKGGTVQFQSLAGSSLTTMGEIKKDGSFALYTLVENKTKSAGAPEGQHRVIVIPPMSEDQVLEEVTLTQPIVSVEPKENHFTIEVEKKPPPHRR
jgi:hypothetical protein